MVKKWIWLHHLVLPRLHYNTPPTRFGLAECDKNDIIAGMLSWHYAF